MATINRLVLTDDDGSGFVGTPLNNALFQDLQNRIDQLAAQILVEAGIRSTNTGDLVLTSGPLRAGFIEADGAALNRADYPALNTFYGTIGYPFGAGNGSTTFNIPDMRGRVPVGLGAAPGLTNWQLAQKGGTDTTTLTTAQIPAHAHSITDVAHNHSINNPVHAHSITDVAHAHGITDPTHTHGVYDPTHAHGINDPTHSHGVRVLGQGGPHVYIVDGGFTDGGANHPPNGLINYNATGVTVQAAATGIGIYGAASGVTVNASGTGLSTTNNAATTVTANASGTGLSTTNNNGSDQPHSNLQPSLGLRFALKT